MEKELNNFKLVKQSFATLRKNIRKNNKKIFQQILKNYYYSKRPKSIVHRCIFCSSIATTKEHIIPTWLHRQFSDKSFSSTINGFEFDFSKVTVPACNKCNNEILSRIERHIVDRLNKIGKVNAPLPFQDMDIVIRWLEIIDYKFQIMNLIQRFIVYRGDTYNSTYANLPLGILRRDLEPSQMLKQLERSIRRIGVENKKSRYNILLQFYRIKDGSEEVFLHGMGNFIALEIPRHHVAFFYFFERRFKDHQAVHAAMEEILIRNAKNK